MGNELSHYQDALNQLVSREGFRNKNRTSQLVESTALTLRHFFEKGSYGTEISGPELLPSAWPYVRYLVADIMRPKFGYGKSLFADLTWSDQFLEDLTREAWEISDILPRDLKHKEWLFMVKVASHMFMEDPFLIENGYINEQGRSRIIGQSLMAGTAPRDMYEMQFEAWKKEFASGKRVILK